ncbi:hypothetical protein AADG42_11575 [Ammonicoccus fulvus]|uniref:Tetratricopeptide repeat protein n=1 Tax=Ammonicoccus fulvus TaxID=3138240 RepID=A0ABZ3FPF1_9ACTN
MSPTREEVAALLEVLEGLPHTEWLTPAEAAHRAAIELGDEELLWWADHQLWTAWSYSGGERTRALPYFVRMVTQLEAQPDWWDDEYTRYTLWAYKGAVMTALSTPDISLDQIEGFIGSMRANYARFGRPDRSVLMTEYRVRRHTHGYPAADELFAQWTEMPRDDLSDCEGCEPTSLALHAAELGRWEEAARISLHVLEEASLHCSEQPQHICAAAVEPLLRTGEIEGARWAHLTGCRLSGHNPHDALEMARHVSNAARAGEPLRALELMEARRRLGFGDPMAELTWLAMGAGALGILAAEHPDLDVHVHADLTETAAGARDRLQAEALSLAARFDDRNGTDTVSTWVRAAFAPEPLPGLDLPVSGLDRVRPAAGEDFATLVQDPIAADARRREIREAEDDLALVALGAAWIDADLPDPATAQALVAAAELDWVAGFVHLRRNEPALLEAAQQRGLRRLRTAGRDAKAALWEMFRLRPPIQEVDDDAIARATDWHAQAASHPDPIEVARAHQAYGEVLHAGQRFDEAAGFYEGALVMLTSVSPDDGEALRLQARILARQAWLPGADSDRLLGEALDRARTAGAGTALLLAQVVQFRLGSGHPDTADSVCEFLDQAGTENDFAAWGAVPLATHPEAMPATERAIPLIQRIVVRAQGTPEGWQALRALADLSLRSGRLLEVAELADQGLRIAESAAFPADEVELGTSHLHMLAAQANDALGDPARAAHHARAYLATVGDNDRRAWALTVIAQHSGLAMDWENALASAQAEGDPANASEAIQGGVLALRREHGPGPALELIDREQPRLAAMTDDEGFTDFITGVCEHWRARMQGDQGGNAEPAFVAAQEAFERADGPQQAIRVRLEHGHWLHRSGRTAEAIEVFRTTAEAAAPLGLTDEAQSAAYEWSEALAELGRDEEAAEVARRFGLTD